MEWFSKRNSNDDKNPQNPNAVANHPEESTVKFSQKRQSWKYGNGSFNIRFIADGVFIPEGDSSTEIADATIWEARIRDICHAVEISSKNNVSKYCPLPEMVEIHFKSNAPAAETASSPDESTNNTSPKTENENIVIREPRWGFDDIYIPPEILDEINRTLTIAKHRDKLFSEWKLGNGQATGRAIVFNFYGPSGTGKSITGEAIAAYLGKKIYAVNYSELESKYVGETPKNIVAAFHKAQSDDAVLIFDEADSFLGKRLTNVTQSADYGVNITRSVMLLELEKFDGVVIFTTNLISNYDEAFKRRILTSIRFDLPNEDTRRRIWEIYLNRGLPLAEGVTAEILARKYSGISGADIKDMLLHAAVSALYRNEHAPEINFNDFYTAFKVIMSRRADLSPAVTISHETISSIQFEQETGRK